MLITFARNVPEEERRWLRLLIRRCARAWGYETWEFRVELKRLPHYAEIEVQRMASVALLRLRPDRFAERTALRTDVLHELWHLRDTELQDAMQDLAAHIPDEKRRRRAFRRANRRYEAWHDQTARLVGRLMGLDRIPPAP